MISKTVIASGTPYNKFSIYADLSKYSSSELRLIEICLGYITSVELMKVTKSKYINAITDIGCDVGYQMIISRTISTDINLKYIRERYIESLCCLLDYIKAKTSVAKLSNDELKEAYYLHLKHVNNKEDDDISDFYNSIMFLSSLDILFKNSKITKYNFIDYHNYINELKALHKVIYKLFVKSKYIHSESELIICPLSGIVDLVNSSGQRTFEYCFFINNTLWMILVDKYAEYNDYKWKTLELKYKALLIEKVTEHKNRDMDINKISQLCIVRVANGEIEIMQDLNWLRSEAYKLYTTKDVTRLLLSLDEKLVSESEFYKILEEK